MQLRSKIIVLVILFSLISVSCYQLYWLISFYNQQYQKMDMAITKAMHDAGFKEIALKVFNSSDSATSVVNVDLVVGNSASGNKMIDNLKLTTLPSAQKLEIDSLKYSSFTLFDSLLQIELHQSGIYIPYCLEYVKTNQDSTISLSRCSANLQKDNRNKFEEYSLPVSNNNEASYRLYLLQPRWHIFKDMLGLVAVSLLMIVLLVVSYIYLLRVIWKQKTVDEIKSDFVSNMTHELKTPIATVYAVVDALQNFDVINNPEKRNEYLSISKNQLMRLNHLVEQILTMSVEERENMKLKIEPISIAYIFEIIRKEFLINYSKTKQLEIELNIQPPNLQIEADKVHFTNIIANLVENAIKYSMHEVKVTMSAIMVKDKVKISVIDKGIGIPKEAIDKVFDKFYRVPTGNIHNVKGYGLGLFYVNTAVIKHGWSIDVKSRHGEGSCFEITI